MRHAKAVIMQFLERCGLAHPKICETLRRMLGPSEPIGLSQVARRAAFIEVSRRGAADALRVGDRGLVCCGRHTVGHSNRILHVRL